MPPILRALPRVYYGWWISLATMVIRGAGTGVFVWSFGVFIPPLEAEFGWSRAAVSAAVSVSFLIAGLCGPLMGGWADRRGARPLLVVGASVASLSLAFLSFTSALWQLYLGYGVMAVGRVGLGYISINTLILRWFSRDRGVALGLSAAGQGVGGFIFVPLTSFLISTLSWRGTYLALAAILWLIVAPISLWVIRDQPPVPPPPEPRQRQGPVERPSALGEIVRSRPFLTLCGLFMLVFFSQFALNVHSVPFLISRGLSRDDAAFAVGMTAGLSILGRLGVGFVSDRWLAPTSVLSLGLALQTAVLVVALASPVEWVALVWILGLGITTGAAGTLEGVIISRVFSAARFGTIQGFIGITETTSVIVGPVFAGYLYDLRGDYLASFSVFALSNVLAVLLVRVAKWRGILGAA